MDEDDWRYARALLQRQSESRGCDDASLGTPHRIWIGTIDPISGLPSTGLRFCVVSAHRLSWLAYNRPLSIPDGNVVRHKCREKACVEPSHLEIGTHAQNAADRLRDGTALCGERSPRAKITQAQAEAIRASKGTGTQAARAARLGVPLSIVANIDRGSSWVPIDVLRAQAAAGISKKRKSPLPEHTAEYHQARLAAIEARCKKVPVDADDPLRERDDQHWVWTLSTYQNGYGQTSFRGENGRVHRFALESYLRRSLSENEVVRHLCASGKLRTCCNPLHCTFGSQKDNVADRRAHGTLKYGSENPCSKCTVEQRAEIRHRRLTLHHKLSIIAADYNIGKTTVRRIVAGDIDTQLLPQ